MKRPPPSNRVTAAPAKRLLRVLRSYRKLRKRWNTASNLRGKAKAEAFATEARTAEKRADIEDKIADLTKKIPDSEWPEIYRLVEEYCKLIDNTTHWSTDEKSNRKLNKIQDRLRKRVFDALRRWI